ncbi:MAG: hypothetical protein NTX52_10050, partial [Planctomycetota bacterium]|nr:hypothetical protein [Planctomycetota bacterium]
TVNATLTPIENKLYIVDDMTNNTVMQANLGSGGMLSISVIYLAYTNPNKDLTNLSTPVPGYSVVIDELIAAEDMGLAIDLSFSGDSTKELYDLLKGTSNVPVSGTLSGQISSEVLVDTNADLSETSFSQSTFIETILGQKSTLSNVEVSGDLSGTINFTNFEIVSIQTGSFAGKGFSKGQFQATLEGAAYTGDWNGLLFLKPDERKIYLKGATSGEISATVEGYLTESVPDSNVYDNYQATWKIGRVRDTTTSATIHISGILTYQGASEFPNTPLYILQSSIEGTASGHYTGPLSTVLTHLRINTVGNPYYGEGFSIISYVSNIGKGEAWAYNNLISPNISELKGISTGPLLGILSGKLDETASPRTLTLTVERIDLGLPPAPDLKVKVWGPGRVSPGQTVNYIIEYRNDGLKAADEALLFYGLDPSVKHISASAEANYDEFYHEVSWNLGVLPAKTARYTSVQVQVEWGLPWGTILDSSALILNMATYKVDVSNNLDSPSKPNLYLGGIDNAVDSNNWKKADAFASEVIAEHPKIYGLGLLQDLSDVTLAAPNYAKVYLGDHTMFGDLQYITVFDGTTYYIYFTRNDNNGLTKSEITNQKYGTVYAYSGGTRTALTAVLHDNLQCDRLVLISPNCGNEIPDYELYKWELEQVRKKYKDMEIVIYQSKKDFVPGGIRFSTKDKDWLQKNNIKVNPGTEEFGFKDPLVIDVMDKDGKIVKKEIKIDENINKQGHGELFSYIKSKLLDKEEMSSDTSSIVAVARDPNRKLGPDGRVLPGDKLQYRVEYENEGEGIAFGVYFTDTLDEDLNEATLEIGPVIDVNSGVQIAPPGTYNPATRTITWFVGQVDPNRGGCADFSVNVKPDAPHGTEIINFATVYFPSVPEATRTNGVVSIVSYNRPPVANAGPDQTVEQESYAGTQVVLDASGSTDPDSSTGTNDDIVSFDWYEGTVLLGTGQT